jgi:hypothetical protein
MRRTWLWVLIGQALLYHLMYGGGQGALGPIVIGSTLGRAAWAGRWPHSWPGSSSAVW